MQASFLLSAAILLATLGACKSSDSATSSASDCSAVQAELSLACLGKAAEPDGAACRKAKESAAGILSGSNSTASNTHPKACVDQLTRYLENGCMNEPECEGVTHETCSADALAVERCFDIDGDGCEERVRKECGSLGCSSDPWGDSSSGLGCRPMNPIVNSDSRSSGPSNTWGILTPGKSLPAGFVEAPDTLIADKNGKLVVVLKSRELFNLTATISLKTDGSSIEVTTDTPAQFEDYNDGYISIVVPFRLDLGSSPEKAELVFDKKGVMLESSSTANALIVKSSAEHL